MDNTQKVLDMARAEVEARRRARPLSWEDRLGRWVTRHWLFILNIFVVLYATLPWVSPLLRTWGWHRAGEFLFWLYSFSCHQRPERAFFVGQYQVCFCHRCTALYGSCAVVALVYGAFRWRWTLPTRVLFLAAVPLLVDGVWHLADDIVPGWGLRSPIDAVGSLNFWLRMATGVVFGVALVAWALPRMNNEIRTQTAR
jgi:uncharacterized membrane protein